MAAASFRSFCVPRPGKRVVRRLWRLLAWAVGICVVIALATPFLSSSLTNKPDAGDKVAGGRGKGRRANNEPTPVLVAKAKKADVPVYVEGVGTGQALNTVLVRSQVDGVLMKLNFTEGQTVKAGDVVAKIDPRLYQATLDQNVAKKRLDEAMLANARRDLDRYKTLIATKAVTQQQYDTQKATVEQNQAQVAIDQALIDSARVTLSYTDVISPISGKTGIRKVDVGNLIHAADTTGIVSVAQIQPIAVIFNVPQQELPRINKATIAGELGVEAMNSGGDKVVDKGTLLTVDNTIDQSTGTVKLKAIYPNPQLQLWPGIFVNVRLKVETLHDAIVVPVAALQHGPQGSFVYTVEDGKAKVRPVVVGQQDDAQAVLSSGVQADDTVITSGFQKMTDGAKVKPSEDTAAAKPKEAPALHHQGVSPPTTGAQPPPEGRPDGGPDGRRRRRQSSRE